MAHALLRTLLVAFGMAVLADCGGTESGSLTGYLEAERRYIGAEVAGRIETLAVTEGDRVDAGALLFRLGADRQRARLARAKARVRQARAALADARTQVKRPQEIAVLEAARADAAAAVQQARRELRRRRALYTRGAIAEAALDDAQTALERRQAALDEAERRIEAARLPSREFRIQAAEAGLAQAQADLKAARIAVGHTRMTAPTEGVIQEVLYRPGEVVEAGRPVVALLPPASLKVRVFVPETRLAAVAVGSRIGVTCDGCPGGLTAEVSFIADEAAFMPPNLLARRQRERLAFLVEARLPPDVDRLPAGLPVTVHLAEAGP